MGVRKRRNRQLTERSTRHISRLFSTLSQNSDGWSAYKRIGELPERYNHMVVKHFEIFVDPESGATTKHVESEWQKFKMENKKRYGTRRTVSVDLDVLLPPDISSKLTNKSHDSLNPTVDSAHLRFSVENLMSVPGAEKASSNEEPKATSASSPTSSDPGPSSSAAPICRTLSYFDVLLPHVQMACNNPFFAASSDPVAMQQRLWSQHWMEMLQHSLIGTPNGEFPAGLFLQPLRKTKRIRTAFSPSQLIHLEKAFESNHYVIGNERKQLASKLGLTETQVKVWFQNRRTKHKRVKLENGAVGSNAEEDKSPSTPMSTTGESIGSGEDEMEASGNDEAAS